MSSRSESSITLKPYPQEFAATVGEPEGVKTTVQCALADATGRVWLGGEQGVLALDPAGPRRYGPEAGVSAEVLHLCQAQGTIYAATAKLLLRREGERFVEVPGEWGQIQALAGRGDHLVLAGDAGLHVATATAWSTAPYPAKAEIRSAAVGPEGEVYLATSQGVWRWDCAAWHTFGAGEGHSGLASVDARAVFVDGHGHAWVGTAAGLQILDGQEWWEQVRGQDGLCYEDITCLAPLPDGGLWIGTSWGLIRLDGGDWHYYAGRRWLPHDRVLAVAATPEAVYAVTPEGVGKIYTRNMTLEDKAARFEERIQKRHYRLGYVADCELAAPGDLEHFTYEASDNDGLWTALYVIAECYRYAVTKDPQARRLASTSLQAMLELQRKCSLPGYVARALVRKDEPNTRKSGGEWHDSADGEYEWKGDTSSDEIDGHLYAYAVYYDLVADAEEKRQIAQVVETAMDYIIAGGLLLLDLDGKPTTWGVWAPSWLNGPREFERGLNSLEILSHLIAAHHITGKQSYLDVYQELVRKHHYALNTVHQKITQVGEVNHSDDELAFCAYHPLLTYEQDPELRRLYLLSFERSWKIERPEHCPWFDFMYGALTGKPFDLEESVRTLRDIPMELVTWATHNSQRTDIETDGEAGRFREAQARAALPADERQVMRWNSNPYHLDSGGHGRSEDDGAAFLLPYWMGRYYGFINE